MSESEEGCQGDDLVTSLRVRCLSEAQPETRFARMLHKKLFEEAEQFAKTFGLDVEVCVKKCTKPSAEKYSAMYIERFMLSFIVVQDKFQEKSFT